MLRSKVSRPQRQDIRANSDWIVGPRLNTNLQSLLMLSQCRFDKAGE